MNYAIMRNNEKARPSMRLSELFTGINIEEFGNIPDIEISGLSVDSRTVQPGDLFIAVPGYSQDGRKYITEAVSLGAAAILTAPGTNLKPDVPVINSDKLRSVVPIIAKRFFGSPSEKMKVAGITGTNGKTTTVYLLASIFNTIGQRWGKIGTISYDTGKRALAARNTTPGPVELQKILAEMVDNGLNGCAMEVSSHGLEQSRCEGIKYASATFTNLTQDHLDYHKDMENYFLAKSKLFDDAPCAVINIDDEYGRRLINSCNSRIITYGSGADSDLVFQSKKTDVDFSIMEFRYKRKIAEFKFPLPGAFNHQNAAAAAATALGLGLSLDNVIKGLSEAQAVPGRLQKVSFGQPFGVYIDYAHTPGALERLLSSIRMFEPENIHVVFGCGGDRDIKKRPLMARAASNLADYVYLTSDNPRTEDPSAIIEDTLAGITNKKACQVIEDRAHAIKAAISSAKEGDIVVIAGKGHEDYQITGTIKKYFSDFEVAKSELRKLGYE